MPSLKTGGSLALARAINRHLHKDNPKMLALVEQGLNQIKQEQLQGQTPEPNQAK
jgi:hypothetical protein